MKLFILTALMIQSGLTASAAWLPPPNSPYWCYQKCIDRGYGNHNDCVNLCYGSNFVPQTEEKAVNSSQMNQPPEVMAAACCSWGENIKGCMPGC